LEHRWAPAVLLGQQPGAPDTTQFHGDAGRTGFNQNETFLTPANVASSFDEVWRSPILDGHLYASPLYVDSVLIQGDGNAANYPGDGVQSPSFQGKISVLSGPLPVAARCMRSPPRIPTGRLVSGPVRSCGGRI
jgi:hypothetical protein